MTQTLLRTAPEMKPARRQAAMPMLRAQSDLDATPQKRRRGARAPDRQSTFRPEAKAGRPRFDLALLGLLGLWTLLVLGLMG